MALADARTRNLLSSERRAVVRSTNHPRIIIVQYWIADDREGDDHQHEEKLLTAIERVRHKNV